MFSALKAFAIGAAITTPSLVNYDPTVLVLDWPSGHQERIAATEPDTCNAAIRAINAGRWLSDTVREAGMPQMRCETGDLFAPGSGWINGYNDPETKGRRQ